jgi:hypothetical protein
MNTPAATVAIAATTLMSLLVSATSALACMCLDRASPLSAGEYRQRLTDFDGVVFSGTVVAVEPGVRPPVTTSTVTFAVERYWKGGATQRLEVVTAEEAMCGVRLELRGRYLLALTRDEDGMLRAQICTRGWYLTWDESAFLAAVGDGAPPEP